MSLLWFGIALTQPDGKQSVLLIVLKGTFCSKRLFKSPTKTSPRKCASLGDQNLELENQPPNIPIDKDPGHRIIFIAAWCRCILRNGSINRFFGDKDFPKLPWIAQFLVSLGTCCLNHLGWKCNGWSEKSLMSSKTLWKTTRLKVPRLLLLMDKIPNNHLGWLKPY